MWLGQGVCSSSTTDATSGQSKRTNCMTGEQFLKAVLNAPPGTRSKIEMLLNGDESVVPSPIADARTCTQAEAARRLGVSRQTVVGWIKLGRIGVMNVAGTPRVLLSSIDALARGHALGGDDHAMARSIAAKSSMRAIAGRKGAAARRQSVSARYEASGLRSLNGNESR